MKGAAVHNPLVSAIVSTYKAERFLRGKLEDLEAQTIAGELEIIVVDSGSPENERAIVEEFQRRYPNIRYLRSERRETVYQAWNRGIREARGEFVTNANTDDRLRPDALEVMVRALRERPECVLAYPDMRITLQENATFQNHQPHGFRDWPKFDRLFLLELCCIGPFPLWRRSLHGELGFFDERFKSAADYEFWLRAALHHDFVHVPQFLGLYWLSPDTVSRKGELPTLEYLLVQKEYRPQYAPLTPPPAILTEEELAKCRETMNRLGEGNLSVAEFERLAELHPRSPRLHHDLAELYYRKGELGYAKKHFEKAAILDPRSPIYPEKLQAFLRSELYQSLQHHTAQAAAQPDDLETRLGLGTICQLLDRPEAAGAHYQAALELDPHCAPARENVARLGAQSGGNPVGGFPRPFATSGEGKVADGRREGNEGAPGSEAAPDYYSFSRPEVRRVVSRQARTVLDIGCATGKLGALLKRRQDATVWGIEPCAKAAAEAEKVLDRVIAAPVEEALAGLPERHFESVILADVLEHLADPEALLFALAGKLSTGGEIVVSLPNVRHWSVLQGLLEGRWDYQDAGILDRTHLRFFTRESALALFERTGYAAASVTPIALTGDSGMPEALLRALARGGVESPTLEAESAVYQYLFRLVRKEDMVTSIVMLTFNELACTKECLESIERNTPEPHELILVDNGSSDGTLAFLGELCATRSHYRLIENGENLGFAAGCNIGMRQASGGRILLINNDVVVTRGWLAGMVETLEREGGRAIVGPMTNRIAGPQQLAATGYRSIDELEEFAATFRSANAGRRLPVDRVVGFCMLFSRRLLEEVGELDQRFGSGNFEDDDFCLRAALSGYRCLIAGDVFIHHYGSRSFAGNGIDYAAAMAKNRRKFNEKWELGRLDQALARRLVTRNAQVKGAKLARQGRLNEAVELLLQEAIACSPGEREPYRQLSEPFIEAARFQDALEVLAEMPPGEEIAKGYLAGLCQLGLGRLPEARRHAEELLALDDGSPAALQLMGLVAAGCGEEAQAEELFRRAMLADPGFAPPYTALSEAMWKKGARETALKLAELGFLLSPLGMSALDRFHGLARALGELALEEQRVREARSVYPEHKGLAYGLIEILIRRGSYLQAMDEIERSAVEFGLDDAVIDAALEIRKLAGPPAQATRGRGGISVCMIVKDEQQQLPAALLSVKGWAAELVVVDTGSSDRTADVARLFGARLFSFPWNGSFSDARNFSLAKAQGDWIMVLDADELLAPCDLPPLTALLERSRSPIAYSFTTRNYTDAITRKNWTANSGEYQAQEQGRGWTPSDKVRLFPNDARLRFEGAVHELLELSLCQCAIPIHACDVPVHHYGRLSEEKTARKQEHYYRLGLKKLAETGGTPESIYELALQATELKRFPEAEGLWQRALGERPESADVHFNLGYLYLATGQFRKAHPHALKAAALAPEMKEAAFNLAKCELLLGNPAGALVLCEQMLAGSPDYPPALSLMSVALLILGRTVEGDRLADTIGRMGFDCRHYLAEYAQALRQGERGELAVLLEAQAERLAGDGGDAGRERQVHAC